MLPGHPVRVTGALPFSAAAFFAKTAASSYAAASRSTKVMAPVGQVGRQSPRPSQ